MTSQSKIYVFAPENLITGGPELLHQLVDYLTRKGKEAYIVYAHAKAGNWVISDTAEVPEPYAAYNVRIAREVEDCSINIVVLPEIMYTIALQTKNSKIYYWWLSVDNYIHSNQVPDKELAFIQKVSFLAKVKILRKRLSRFLRGKKTTRPSMSLDILKQRGGIHLCQSAYAKDFITKIGGGALSTLMLKDYVNDIYINSHINTTKRKKQLLYNPKKGYEYTQSLLKLVPSQYKCIPLIGYNREELIHLMQESSLYIDFGNHPGMDRLPRECAANGCCIITGKRGAAGYREDYPFPEMYSISEKNRPQDICNLIVDILENYEHHSAAFEGYRAFIKAQKSEFFNAIDEIFLTQP